MNKVIGNTEDSPTNPDKRNQLSFPEGHDTWAIFKDKEVLTQQKRPEQLKVEMCVCKGSDM